MSKSSSVLLERHEFPSAGFEGCTVGSASLAHSCKVPLRQWQIASAAAWGPARDIWTRMQPAFFKYCCAGHDQVQAWRVGKAQQLVPQGQLVKVLGELRPQLLCQTLALSLSIRLPGRHLQASQVRPTRLQIQPFALLLHARQFQSYLMELDALALPRIIIWQWQLQMYNALMTGGRQV